MVVFNELVAVPERATIANDHFHACLLGGGDDGRVTGATIGVRVLFEDKVSGFPGFEELGKEGLGSFAEEEKFGFWVELGEGGGEIVLAIDTSFPSVDRLEVSLEL